MQIVFYAIYILMKEQMPPLAFRVRPKELTELLGQKEAKAFLEDFIQGKRRSVMLWGPPGAGKTSIANILNNLFPDSYFAISAVTGGIKEIRGVTQEARKRDVPPIVFIDEVHRFTKVQQDALLPHVESGDIVLVGATTENPSFSITSPLLSRLQVIALKALKANDITLILANALASDLPLQSLNRTISQEGLNSIAKAADGDARSALNLLELVMLNSEKEHIDLPDIKELLKRPLYHDRAGDAHYDLISVFHKCVRASDVDASLYWLGRMLEAGEDRLFILRRMIRMASEDIGMAEPHALRIVISAKDAFTTLGSPEGELAIYQAAVYLACAPKSNALYLSEMKVKKLIEASGTPAVPLSLRNAPTRLMRDLGYAKGYIYAHDDPDGALTMQYLPEGIPEDPLYLPKDAGFEKRLKEIINARRKAKRDRSGSYRKASEKQS